MKKKKIILLFLCSFLFACSEKQAERIPADILSKEKMAEVLVDIHLLEASMNLNATPGRIAAADIHDMQIPVDVLKKNNTTKKQYDDSFFYYSQHPEVLSEIYQLVLNTFSKMQAETVSKK